MSSEGVTLDNKVIGKGWGNTLCKNIPKPLNVAGTGIVFPKCPNSYAISMATAIF